MKTSTDQESKPIDYFIKIDVWDEDQLVLDLTFEEPLSIGQGRDAMLTEILATQLFISARTGRAMPAENGISALVVPTQMARGVTESVV